MIRKGVVQEGLEILTRIWGGWYLAAEHDQIWVYALDNQEKMIVLVTGEDKARLEKLGWFIDDTWSHYV